MRDDLESVLLTTEQIQARTRELGQQICGDYAGRDILLVGVLKGALMFMVDLARAIDLPVEMDFMAISSYGASTKSSGVVRILKDLDVSIEGRDVLIVEDVVDTGLTLRYICENLATRDPASIRICSLLLKQRAERPEIKLDYVGFEIPDRFVVGYGLDYSEVYRNLPYIGVLSPAKYAGEDI
ncbi:MAG TPA: hypoxanthine phosphoribosyltransferase [Chloroflexota bacterium]|nr:hypoxanthine phosphoribosyltransferase [Chloroflexota bacterium]